MAKKKRYVEDGKIFFVQVTLVLHNGRIITGIDDTTIGDVDSNYRAYHFRAMEKWGDQVDTCEIEMISKHDPRAKKYMKDNNISIPNSEPKIVEDKPPPPVTWNWSDRKKGPGKYRSGPGFEHPYTLGEMAAIRKKNEEGTRG